jgi:transcriptional regulator with XRE-family HTH domain
VCNWTAPGEAHRQAGGATRRFEEGEGMSNLATRAPAKPRQRRRTIIVDGPHPIDLHVGSRIRLQRILRGLTQSDLAKLVDISFQSVQKYERGENRVSASRLHEFAVALAVNEQFFFDGLGAEEPAPPINAVIEPSMTAAEGKELQRQLTAVMAIEDKRLRSLVIQLLKLLTEVDAARPLAASGSPAQA